MAASKVDCKTALFSRHWDTLQHPLLCFNTILTCWNSSKVVWVPNGASSFQSKAFPELIHGCKQSWLQNGVVFTSLGHLAASSTVFQHYFNMLELKQSSLDNQWCVIFPEKGISWINTWLQAKLTAKRRRFHVIGTPCSILCYNNCLPH